jgi:hypothetical protein
VVEVERALHAAFAHLAIEIVPCVATDGVVATHKVYRRRHVGDWLEGRRRAASFVRVPGGRFVEHWSVLGQLSPIQ